MLDTLIIYCPVLFWLCLWGLYLYWDFLGPWGCVWLCYLPLNWFVCNAGQHIRARTPTKTTKDKTPGPPSSTWLAGWFPTPPVHCCAHAVAETSPLLQSWLLIKVKHNNLHKSTCMWHVKYFKQTLNHVSFILAIDYSNSITTSAPFKTIVN